MVEKGGALQSLIEDRVSLEKRENSSKEKPPELRKLTRLPSKLDRSISRDAAKNLTNEEELLTGSVNYKVYIRYIKNSGLIVSVCCLIGVVMYQVFAIMTNISLTSWAEDENSANPEKRDEHLAIYGGLGLGQSKEFSFALANLL